MKRIIILVEGHTEEEFVKTVLAPFMYESEIFDVRAIKVRTSKSSKGGLSNYIHLKNDLNRILLKEKDIVISTMVDYYQIPSSFPGFTQCQQGYQLIDARIDCLERKMAEDINHPVFLPYIQKHEFEALVLASAPKLFEYLEAIIPSKSARDKVVEEVKKWLQHDGPEDINSGRNTAPSKRLIQLIPGYDKVIFGNLVIKETGMEELMKCCPRFENWVNKLVEMATQA